MSPCYLWSSHPSHTSPAISGRTKTSPPIFPAARLPYASSAAPQKPYRQAPRASKIMSRTISCLRICPHLRCRYDRYLSDAVPSVLVQSHGCGYGFRGLFVSRAYLVGFGYYVFACRDSQIYCVFHADTPLFALSRRHESCVGYVVVSLGFYHDIHYASDSLNAHSNLM